MVQNHLRTSLDGRAAFVLVMVAASSGLLGGCATREPGDGSVGTSRSALAVTGLFSTGVDDSGAVLAVGTVDPHYTLTSDDAALPGPDALAVNPAGGWTGNTATSLWISAQDNATGGNNKTYTFTTSFSLAGVDPATATLSGSWACDDSCVMTLNGATIATYAAPAWQNVIAFNSPPGSPFVLGENTLAVSVLNSGGGATGLQIVSIIGSVNGCDDDSQCDTTTQFCDTQAAACTARLPNGTGLPILSGHSPTLDGTCSLLVGASVCASLVCDATNQECGYADGDGPCVDGSVCQSGACSVDGTCEPPGGCNEGGDCASGFCENHICVQCIDSSSCSGATPVCDLPTFSCVPCGSDFGSGGLDSCPLSADPACQPAGGALSGQCTVCSATNGTLCAAGDPLTPVCVLASGTCGCNVDDDCPLSDICTSNGSSPICAPGCREVSGADHCAPGQICSEQDGTIGICDTEPCTDSTQCSLPTPICDLGVEPHLCVQCVLDMDCASNVCDTTTNTCVECTQTNTTNCSSKGDGPLCLSNDTCGCAVDQDCGGLTSGRVCGDTAHTCEAGCRGTGGNGCPTSETCSSSDHTIGQCTTGSTTTASGTLSTGSTGGATGSSSNGTGGGGVTGPSSTGHSTTASSSSRASSSVMTGTDGSGANTSGNGAGMTGSAESGTGTVQATGTGSGHGGGATSAGGNGGGSTDSNGGGGSGANADTGFIALGGGCAIDSRAESSGLMALFGALLGLALVARRRDE